LATLALQATREVPLPIERVKEALRSPETYSAWVPGVVSASALAADGSFNCAFRFSMFDLKFKVQQTEVEADSFVFHVNAIVIGKVTGRVTLKAQGDEATEIHVALDGALRGSSLHRLAMIYFERGADVVSERLTAHLAG
jgi:carbon monoxide dehydrogenase subunit G